MKQNNYLLTGLVGLPISAFALFLAYVCLLSSYRESSQLEALVPAALAVGFVWAVFTGIRNLLRFENAHLHLRWHDWVGGILGFAANILLMITLTSVWIDRISRSYDISFPYLAAGVVLSLSSAASLICFSIVVVRFIRKKMARL